MKDAKTILPEYAMAIQKGLDVANSCFPDAHHFIKKFEIGNAGLFGEPDGTRLGRCQYCPEGIYEIYLSKALLSEKHPDRNMDIEIEAAILHEYAHVSATVYAYKRNPLKMYLSLLLWNQRKIEASYVSDFYDKHEKNDFTRHVLCKRFGEDVVGELISEAYESVYKHDEYAKDAQLIVEDYQQILASKPFLSILIYSVLLHTRNLLLRIFTVLIYSISAFAIFLILRDLIGFIWSMIS